jgi:hypothetical protein
VQAAIAPKSRGLSLEKVEKALLESKYPKGSEFEIWCINNGRQPFPNDRDTNEDNLHYFIMQKNLNISPIDEPKYPGLTHAAASILEILHIYMRHVGFSSKLYSYSQTKTAYGDLTRNQR